MKKAKKTIKKPSAKTSSNPTVAIIMGSQSDLKVMSEAGVALKDFGVNFHVEIVSAHRTPDKMVKFAKSAAAKGFKVIIAGAGGAAHLPGMVASLTTLPVIGVPVNVTSMNGLDALLSIVQMPKGVPVATVAVDNAYNAGLLAAKILAICKSDLTKKLFAFNQRQKLKIAKMNKSI